jgi:hypothetical protein
MANEDAIQERLASMLEFIDTGLREGKEFSIQQAPEVAREIVA